MKFYRISRITSYNVCYTKLLRTNSTAKYSIAVYITNSSGSLVNTMLYGTSNGHSSAQDMTTFWSKIGSSWSTSSSKLLTTADAVTGATATSPYSNQKVYWGKLASISSANDGTYTVNFEMANFSNDIVSRRYTSGTFVKGATASTTTLPTIVGFTSITIDWAPLNTALESVEQEKMYSVYPNPALSDIYVSGIDIKGIDICSLSGKLLLNSKVQNLNISSLPKGAYLAVIYTKSGTVVKKIEKL